MTTLNRTLNFAWQALALPDAMFSMKRLIIAAAIAAVALVSGAPAASAATREYEGTVVSVDRGARTFKIRDSERGTIRVKVTSSTRFERLSLLGPEGRPAQHRDHRPPLQRPLGRRRGRALRRRRQPRRRRSRGRRLTKPTPTSVGSASTRRSCVAAAPRIAASAPRLEGMTGGTAPLPPRTRRASSEAITGASHSVIGAKCPPRTIACGLSRFTTVPSATPSQRPQSASAAERRGVAGLGAAHELGDRLGRAARAGLAVDPRGRQQRLEARAGLQAAVAAAGAGKPVGLDRRMAELAAEPAIAAEQLAAEHDAAADADLARGVDEVAVLGGRALPELGQRGEVGLVVDAQRQ